ncbi:hypothetical protein LTR10_015607 [Elasticomyces elasticus]|uniref:Nicotinamide N-methyltransferase n=1 Tax=Exophiala sideris TaxID=1016849 RepID=A0ABR0JL27_9EURO|nr:hypothetical protein LTR10_015607 [Elasticomyces elasticus]KAK5036317.1 hypothetical protein LTS07_002043 [Exophiala sideris]KAK5041852.1 hypothetical protein LTR13_002519 [Exophiala sideris]KAK5066700.1 hypothetical protein LTR69_002047 [Exophiala sideris]KAK5184758.1 hypothetical protein LTR44_002604 [Eurotiomycetes sp. CCFEE 6388]
MFPSRVCAPLRAAPESEDIFESALSNLFTDDTQNSHGTPGQSVVYDSPRFGKIALRIPAHPDVEEGRKLFAHYLWNAGVIAADAIECASRDGVTDCQVQWDRRHWDVRGKRLLELGAGTALPSIISALSGAASLTITDHPSSPALTMGAIEQNLRENVLETPRVDHTNSRPVVNVFGYTWGTTKMYLPNHYGKPAPEQLETFDRIIIADCLWMPSQHVNLVKTILHYLESSQKDACAFVLAGFHTGRATVRRFFEIATGEWREEDQGGDEDEDEDEELRAVQGRLKAADIFEIDTNGVRRPWLPSRPGEDKQQTRRWTVCAVLVRR